ncbi:MAG: uracil-DNA glycosylase [Deltaproteobacteria bacterium]|jgi:DNA polymerase|nr:uracil-DNA glycosylase [Deltaproteobacteria bacterium]MBW2565775.1 uracil-DNA glycosylase [Deltaproteobacteria bacterium]
MTEAIKAFNESSTQLLPEIREDLKAYLQYMKGLGYSGVALSENSVRILEGWNKGGVAETLDTIQVDLGACQRCKLHKGRKHVVFGVGNPRARLAFVGEGPGYEEDMQGEPFVGKAGQLLTKILRAIGLTREDVYICNIIKCRPPGNRNPEPDEIAACIPFLRRQLRAIGPGLICALGSFAAQTLLATKTPISRLRGNFYTYEGSSLLPTYHPAFLLRNPAKKADVWEDMQKLQEAYEKI